ncbi:MAG: Fe-S cluster assembly protein SufD, partial [Fimbriimonas ginsengisoli]|nr:Fe-S cluster assembly protein SufD [Fimbriimonas ginsengisoli]
HSLVAAHAALEPSLAAMGPATLRELRRNALAEFVRLGFPGPKHEEWKYTHVRALEETEFAPAYGAKVDRNNLKGTVGGLALFTLAFVNGERAPELDQPQALPDGVFVGSLADAFDRIPRILERFLARQAGIADGKLGSHLDMPFVRLNEAYMAEGAVVSVPSGVQVEAPIHLLFVSKAGAMPFAAHPRVLIVVEEGASATVIESYLGHGGTYFTNCVTEVAVGQGATLEHVRLQQETLEAFHLGATQVHQAGGSTYTSNAVSFGGRLARHDLGVRIEGERTETLLNGAYVGMGDQLVDNHTRIDHAKPNCNSFEVYKGILGGRATGVFNGKIFVYQDAQKTDAKQTNQALLLSREASVNTKPQLEIFADDVKCTHGATVGQIREDALFYLRSRGLGKAEAEAMLVFAFAAEVLEKISVRAYADLLEQTLFAKLEKER